MGRRRPILREPFKAVLAVFTTMQGVKSTSLATKRFDPFPLESGTYN